MTFSESLAAYVTEDIIISTITGRCVICGAPVLDCGSSPCRTWQYLHAPHSGCSVKEDDMHAVPSPQYRYEHYDPR